MPGVARPADDGLAERAARAQAARLRAGRPRSRGSRRPGGRTMPVCSDDSRSSSRRADPTTTPSMFGDERREGRVVEPFLPFGRCVLEDRQVHIEKTGERTWCSPSDDVEPAEDGDVAPLGASDGRSRAASRTTSSAPPARGSRGRAAGRTRAGTRHRRAPDPSAGRRRSGSIAPASTQPAAASPYRSRTSSGLGDGVTGALDPHVRAPRAPPRGAAMR